jgi:hypothetical protein
MKMRLSCWLLALSAYTLFSNAQDSSNQQLSILTKDLPAASLWSLYPLPGRYGLGLRAAGGVATLHWQVAAGSLPRGLQLSESGYLSGIPQEAGEFPFTVLLTDGTQEARKRLALNVKNPLTALWLHKAHANGQRIDGSIKVSNTSGRDFDLTFIVLAVNDIGRATAIGYQHFPLKKNTDDLEIPFGDTLSSGNYVVHVDVVGEEPISNMIFRTRLVTEQQAITPEP